MTTDLREQLQTTLGTSYTIERELGGGGMSRVFVAEETALGRKVVIKVLPPELAGSVNVDRFRREIMLAARLRHPLIVPIIIAGEADGLLYFTMPYVDGESLRTRLEREGPLPIPDAVRVVRDVAEALSYAHRHGVVHRDVKPGNVLLDSESGHALVTDFGVAKALSAATESEGALTSIGMALGTPAYSAPEQALGDPTTDHRADLYALGVVAYEVLTGKPPFSGRTPQQLVGAHVTERPEPLAARSLDSPPGLTTLVTQLLEKAPTDRPQSAEEVLRRLDTVQLPSREAAPAARLPLPRPHATRRRWLAAVALVVLLAVGVTIALWARSERSTAGAAPTGAASIAVLPFENVSGDTAQAYFADGMTDELAIALDKVPGLQVAARTSSYAFRGRQADVRDVGRQLGVGAVLTGAVRRAGPQLRVTAQLADARTGLVRWSDAYSAESTDVFAVQTRLAGAIVKALAPTFSLSRDAPVTTAVAAVVDTSRGTDDPVAYDLYLRGRHLWYQRRDLLQAESLFKAAVARDPRFARAYTGLALTYAILAEYTSRSLPFDTRDATRRAAARALALDSTQAEAHAALGYAAPRGETHFRRALALDPRSEIAHLWYGVRLLVSGRVTEALAETRRAAELDPLSPVNTASLARALAWAGRREEALSAAQRAVALDSSNVGARGIVGQAFMRLGEYRRAAAEYETVQRLNPGDPLHLGQLAEAYALAGERQRALALTAELERRRREDDRALAALVPAYAALGNSTRALDALDASIARGRGEALVRRIANEDLPMWAPLRRDPRFARLRDRILERD